MDTYQAIYDAVRSKIGNGDIGEVIRSVISEMNIEHYAAQASQSASKAMQDCSDIAQERKRPSVLFRLRLSIDGNMWCALYGENLQDGVAGFGKSPAEAMTDFDKNYHQKLNY